MQPLLVMAVVVVVMGSLGTGIVLVPSTLLAPRVRSALVETTEKIVLKVGRRDCASFFQYVVLDRLSP